MGFFEFIQWGLFASGFGLVVLSVARNMSSLLGYEPLQPQDFIYLFDDFYEWLLGGVERDISKISSSPRKTQALLIISISSVAGTFAVAIELWGMIAVTGVAFAGYHIFGITPDLPSSYQFIIYVATLLAISLMVRGSERAQHIALLQ